MKKIFGLSLYLILPFLLICTTALAFMIDAQLRDEINATGDPFYRLMGSSKEILGDAMFLKADSYFHGGSALHYEEGTGQEGEEAGSEDAHEHKAAHAEEPAEAKDWIARINERIQVSDHHHLPQDKQREMLPFLYLATTLDTHNTEAFLTSAYILDKLFGKTSEAVEVLKTGMKNNPASWELARALGDIFYLRKQNYALAEVFYKRAFKYIPVNASRFNRIQIQYSIAEVLIRQGKKEEALKFYQSALALYSDSDRQPLKKIISDKVENLM